MVRYLNLADHDQTRITKSNKRFAKTLDFKSIKYPVKVRDIHKIMKKKSIGITVFACQNKEKHSIYVSKKCCEAKHVF